MHSGAAVGLRSVFTTPGFCCEYKSGVNKKAANVHGARFCVSRSQPKLHIGGVIHTKKCNFLV